MKHHAPIFCFLLLLFISLNSYAAFFLPTPYYGIGMYSAPNSVGVIKSLSIYTPRIYISKHDLIRVVVLYSVEDGKKVEGIKFFESTTHLPLSDLGIIVKNEVKETDKLSWFERIKDFSEDIILENTISVTNQHMTKKYIKLIDGEPSLAINLCVELTLTSGEIGSTCLTEGRKY